MNNHPVPRLLHRKRGQVLPWEELLLVFANSQAETNILSQCVCLMAFCNPAVKKMMNWFTAASKLPPSCDPQGGSAPNTVAPTHQTHEPTTSLVTPAPTGTSHQLKRVSAIGRFDRFILKVRAGSLDVSVNDVTGRIKLKIIKRLNKTFPGGKCSTEVGT